MRIGYGFASRVSRRFGKSVGQKVLINSNTSLFALEGVLIALVTNIIINYNNLLATRLGAGDFEVSLVVALPQFIGMLVLIPGGILTDRLQNKRKMVIASLAALIVTYAALAFTPMFGQYRLLAFIVLLSLSYAPFTLYNTSWQAFFSDTVSIEYRNRTYTIRTGFTFLINIIIPIMTGFMLRSAVENESKLMLHQFFFGAACLFLLVQIIVLGKISGGNIRSKQGIRFRDLKNAAKDLAANKKFLGFAGVALFFYITWQSDWALYFLGQVNYLKLDEAWLGFVNVGAAVAQFLTVILWSFINEKLGIRFSMILGSLGLACCPLSIIIGTSVPAGYGPVVFLILNTLSNLTFPAVSLGILQCLLQVIPEKNKSLSISIYTVLITLSNVVMPIMGVKLYSVLGSTLQAFHTTFWIIFAARILATLLWALRWRMLRHEPK